MASGRGKRPPDKSSEKYYKCHPRSKVATLICIICGSAYHKSDFERKENTRDLGDNLVICSEHDHVPNITYDDDDEEELNETAKYIIAQIKMKQIEEIRKEYMTELQSKTQELHNATVDDEAEKDIIFAEYTLLKQLNKELQDKNQLLVENNRLLREKLKIKSENENENLNFKKTFANVVTEIKQQPKKIPKIIIKTKGNEQTEVKNAIAKQIMKEKNIQTKNVYIKNKNEIVVNCMTRDSVLAAEKLLTKKLIKCEVTTEQLNKPKIKIVGIENTANMEIEAIEEDINIRNFREMNCKGSVLHMYTNKKTNRCSVIMEVPAEIYKIIRERDNRIFVGHQRCVVYDQINITTCYNCGRLGHNGKKCRNKQICIKCSGNHKTSECNNDKYKCVNCAYSNNNYDTKYDTKHSPSDMENCEILKKKIKKYVDTTDYPIKPVLPTWKSTSVPAYNRRPPESAGMLKNQRFASTTILQSASVY